jgi:hypothetical protein
MGIGTLRVGAAKVAGNGQDYMAVRQDFSFLRLTTDEQISETLCQRQELAKIRRLSLSEAIVELVVSSDWQISVSAGIHNRLKSGFDQSTVRAGNYLAY